MPFIREAELLRATQRIKWVEFIAARHKSQTVNAKITNIQMGEIYVNTNSAISETLKIFMLHRQNVIVTLGYYISRSNYSYAPFAPCHSNSLRSIGYVPKIASFTFRARTFGNGNKCILWDAESHNKH